LTDLLKKTKEILISGENTCVVCTEKQKHLISKEKGIKPILLWLREDKNSLKNAIVADRIIGRAAAMLMVYAGIKEVYGILISDHALTYFQQFETPVYYKEKVPYILNRTKTSMCPMEKRSLFLETPKSAFDLFNQIIE